MQPEFPVAADALLSRYRTVICDVWGVVHDGLVASQPACAALARFRAGGGTVVLVTNSPSTAGPVIEGLDEKGVPRGAWDGIVTSGDMTRLRLVEMGVRRIYHTGSERHLSMTDGLGLEFTGIDDAEAILATELFDYFTELPEDYRPVLERGLARGLPFVCANPDLVVHVGDDLLPCAGALALIYEQMGGEVYYAGKPYPPIYERALHIAQQASGRPRDLAATLAIGDAVRTDMAGAAGLGCDALFVAGGIHRDETMPGGVFDPASVAPVIARYPETVVAVMPALA